MTLPKSRYFIPGLTIKHRGKGKHFEGWYIKKNGLVTKSNGLLHTFASDIDQFLACFINVANSVSTIGITMETIIKTTDINIEDITIF